MGNWQRGGGKGSKPKPVKRPQDSSARARNADPKTADELAARRARTRDELKRRRVSNGN